MLLSGPEVSLGGSFRLDGGTSPAERLVLIANEEVERDLIGFADPSAGDSSWSPLRSSGSVNLSGTERDRPARESDGALGEIDGIGRGFCFPGISFGGRGGGTTESFP